MILFAHLLISAVMASGQIKPEYRAAIVSTLPEPLIILKNNSIEGVVKDYLTAIGTELNAKFEIGLLPRLRIDRFDEEKYDLNCYSSYAWNDNHDRLLWSKPIFVKRAIIVGTIPLPASIHDFNGQAIGTIRGYKYPYLTKLFKEKKLIREDAEDEESNLLKLANGRVQFATSDELILNYFKRKSDAGKKILPPALAAEEFPVQCALRKDSKITLEKLNHAIESIISSGKLEKIFNKYK